MKYTNETNKIVGAGLFSILVLLGLSFVTEVMFGHHEESTPVYLAAATMIEPDADSVAAESDEAGAATVDIAALVGAADLGRGEKLFKKCKACHGTKQGGAHKIGPNLWDVVGAAKARHGDFTYSGGLADKGGVWDYAALDAFLTKPKDYSPGTKMAFPGLKSGDDRAAVIAFLRAASDSPAPLE
ncbi:MAG: cytochrome c family protein [Alphaproteobacteria bacterium]